MCQLDRSFSAVICAASRQLVVLSVRHGVTSRGSHIISGHVAAAEAAAAASRRHPAPSVRLPSPDNGRRAADAHAH